MNKQRIFTNIMRLLAVLLITLGLAAPIQRPAAAAALDPQAAPLNQISGTVLVEGGSAPAGAVVLAWRGDKSFSAPVNPTSGAYSLLVGAGDWQVTVSPGLPSGTSPDWVYAGGPQAVSFSANPDPDAPVKTIDLAVVPAGATLSGAILAPGGAATLEAPNRVWVRAENQEGIGNTVLADPLSGAFSIQVLPGNTLLKLAFENERWAPPVTLAGSTWYLADGAAADAGSLQLLEKNARITGLVVDQDLAPIAGIPVRAWRLDGAENAKTLTAPNGTFSLWVVAGVWDVQVTPPAASPYVPAQDPKRVTLLSETGTQAVALKVYLADVTVQGSLVDALGAAVPGLNGHINALYKDGERWPQFGPGAAIKNSAFTLKLSSQAAANYRLKGSFPSAAGYTVISEINLAGVVSGQTYTVTLPVAPNNSTISGSLLDKLSGLPRLGLPGAIYGASDSGAQKRARVNPLDGSYQIQAAAVDSSGHGGTFWYLHAFVDPTTGFQVLKPRNEKVFLPYNNGAGADVTANFTVAAVNSLITGRLVDEHGTAVPGAKVSLSEPGAAAGLAYRRWVLTNANGRFSIPVPAGTYKLAADYRNWISPLPASVTIGANTLVDLNQDILHGEWAFRQKDATLSGSVSFAGSPHTAAIRAYSNSGAHVIGLTNASGHYSLAVNSGDTWHVQAVSEEGSQFLLSSRVKVAAAPGANPGVDLELLAADTLPEMMIFSFDSTQDQAVTLSNGAQVIIPAGAMAESGMVTLVVRPLAELADDGGAQPVSFGYRLLAFDENHLPIDHFNTAVVLSMPFTAEQLAKLGVQPENLIPSYWDVATLSWKPIPNYSLQVDAAGGGALNLSIDHFTDYGMLSQELPLRVFLPQVMK